MSEMAAFDPNPTHAVEPLGPDMLSVRLATVADAPSIARISAAREGLDVEAIVPRIEGELAGEHFGDRLGVWVASVADQVVGYGRARWDDQARDMGPLGAPPGWYLMGVVVDPAWRRRGIGRAFLRARLVWVAERASEAYATTSEFNPVSQALLKSEGFEVVQRDVRHPRITFARGVGLLLRATLNRPSTEAPKRVDAEESFHA